MSPANGPAGTYSIAPTFDGVMKTNAWLVPGLKMPAVPLGESAIS
jgi:hypothetical protein